MSVGLRPIRSDPSRAESLTYLNHPAVQLATWPER